jgi:electron transfer flavoprotein beta subunit
MKIIVCIKEVVDIKLSLDFGLTSKVVFGEGLPLRLNPNDAAAMVMALGLKAKGVFAEITLVTIGRERVESYLREGLAAGVDKTVRLWEEEVEIQSPYQKAKVLSQYISISGADLVFMGASAIDTGDGLVGPLTSSRLGLPYICEVVDLQLSGDEKTAIVTRDIGKGGRERLECKIPAVFMVKGEGRLPYADMERHTAAQRAQIPCLALSDIGLSPMALKSDPIEVTGLVFPRPRTKKITTPDSNLPAFDRVLKLLEGGMKKRKGKILTGSSDELANQLFNLLQDEGVIYPEK